LGGEKGSPEADKVLKEVGASRPLPELSVLCSLSAIFILSSHFSLSCYYFPVSYLLRFLDRNATQIWERKWNSEIGVRILC
jgi:hypothetical protein